MLPAAASARHVRPLGFVDVVVERHIEAEPSGFKVRYFQSHVQVRLQRSRLHDRARLASGASDHRGAKSKARC